MNLGYNNTLLFLSLLAAQAGAASGTPVPATLSYPVLFS